MPAAVQSAGQEGAPPQGGGSIPFIVGSNLYREPPFFSQSQALDTNSHEFVFNITPGGFLRGITLQVTSSGGVLGTNASLSADSPYSIFRTVSIEDISGGPIIYPINGYAARVKQMFFTPWQGDPSLRSDFSNTINPAFTLRLDVEVRDTLAVLANTDARAQYRIRFALNPLTVSSSDPTTGLVSTSSGVTGPTVVVNGYIETWAQPDLQDLLGNSIEGLPHGLAASRFIQHEVPVTTSGTNVTRHTLMGNEIRAIAWIFRNSSNARTNLTDANAGSMEFRLDSRRLWKMKPTQIVEEMQWFYQSLGLGTWTRPAGVYIVPRFRQPGDMVGEYWLQTVEQTLLLLEWGGADIGAGTLEILYDQLAVAGTLSGELEGI